MRIFWQSFTDETMASTYLGKLRAHLMEAALPGTTVDVGTLSPPDTHVHPLSEMRCARLMIKNAVKAEREGYDAFVVGHFQEPGLREVRGAVGIPVMGLGEATLLHALTLGAKVGVVTIHPRYIPWIERQASIYGVADRLCGVRAMTFQPEDLTAAFDEPKALRKAQAGFEAEVAPLLDAGAEVVIAGGGIPMLLFGGIRAYEIDGAPVIDGLPVTLMHAETAVRLRQLNGLTISRRGEMARAPDDLIDLFVAD
ncbi:MAG: aspartate/glutamate racemase family protein [Pseudomonadota bacterium]